MKVNSNKCDICFDTDPNIDLKNLVYTKVMIENDNIYILVNEEMNSNLGIIAKVTNDSFCNNIDKTDPNNASISVKKIISTVSTIAISVGIGSLIAWSILKSTPKNLPHNDNGYQSHGGNGGDDKPGGGDVDINNYAYHNINQPKENNHNNKLLNLLSAGAGALVGAALTIISGILSAKSGSSRESGNENIKIRGGAISESDLYQADSSKQINNLHKLLSGSSYVKKLQLTSPTEAFEDSSSWALEVLDSDYCDVSHYKILALGSHATCYSYIQHHC
jgi:hypothetical protein